jgi:hypothetical protein
MRGAHHCNDLLVKNAEVNGDIGAAAAAVRSQIKTWVAEFYH